MLAKEADLAGVCNIAGIEHASEEFAGLPIAQEEVLHCIVRKVCILTGVQYQDPDQTHGLASPPPVA